MSEEMPKEKIHPNYAAVHVKCACGNHFETRSTHKGDIHVEICSACHPFFTGKQRLVDTAGRVERSRRSGGLSCYPAESATVTWLPVLLLLPFANRPWHTCGGTGSQVTVADSAG